MQGSAQFSSTTQHYAIASNLGINSPTQAYTISLWLNQSTAPSGNQYQFVWTINKGLNQGFSNALYDARGGSKHLYVDGEIGDYYVDLGTNTWHHIVLTKASGSGGITKMYVDGALVKTGTSGAVGGAAGGDFHIGDPGSTLSAMQIDAAGVWTRELTASEVAQLYTGAAHGNLSATTTTSAAGAWSVMIGVPSTGGTATAGAGTTLRQQQSGNLYYADTNGPITPAGSATLSWHTPTSTHWITNHFSLPPVYANPGTQYTTGYTYDANGNLTQTQVGATTTTYTYDYANCLITTQVNSGPVTSYTYDHSGARITQTTGNTTTIYPTRYYSLVQTTSGTTTYATSTEYVFAGDRVVATIDQPYTNGTSTGTSTVRFVHQDHLGSTNVVSTSGGAIAQWFDYAPYGSILGSSGSGMKRQYIGQYADDSGLSYLNARYYDSGRGQFVSEDPVFWGVQVLSDPQSLNSYGYGNSNPVKNSDPLGKSVYAIAKAIEANSMGTHVFLVLQPDNISDFANSGISIQKGGYWTVGGYASSDGSTLIKGTNASSDLTAYQTGYSIPSTQQGGVKSIQLVPTPSGMTDTQFINGIQSGYNGYAGDAQYDPFALEGYNSNSLVTTWIKGAGGKLPFKGNAPGVDPGFGRSLPSNYSKSSGTSLVPTSVSGTLSRAGSYSGATTLTSMLSSLSSALTQLRSILSSISSSKK